MQPADPTGEGFGALGVPEPLCQLLAESGIRDPFPIQQATIPPALSGRDVLGQGRTGSGKTLAFSIPAVLNAAALPQPADRAPRVLILSPTRELASQIRQVVEPLAASVGLRTAAVFGGVPHASQRRQLEAGVDVLVACPGRLLDLMSEGSVRLGSVSVCVLDEADMMADHGFLPQVRRIMDALPPDGQRMLFSATLADGVPALVDRYLSDPVSHRVADGPPPRLTHRVLTVSSEEDRFRTLLRLCGDGPTVVFCRTKRRTRLLARRLAEQGVRAVELHGNLSQAARTRNLAGFVSGAAQVLVATDIAARGIHVDAVSRVVHADPPAEHTAYLHRSGRTARAGQSGEVVTLVSAEQREDVSRLLRRAGVPADGQPHAAAQTAPRRRARRR